MPENTVSEACQRLFLGATGISLWKDSGTTSGVIHHHFHPYVSFDNTLMPATAEGHEPSSHHETFGQISATRPKLKLAIVLRCVWFLILAGRLGSSQWQRCGNLSMLFSEIRHAFCTHTVSLLKSDANSMNNNPSFVNQDAQSYNCKDLNSERYMHPPDVVNQL
jgi:hypothetical protein